MHNNILTLIYNIANYILNTTSNIKIIKTYVSSQAYGQNIFVNSVDTSKFLFCDQFVQSFCVDLMEEEPKAFVFTPVRPSVPLTPGTVFLYVGLIDIRWYQLHAYSETECYG